jgi:hypothetical protein
VKRLEGRRRGVTQSKAVNKVARVGAEDEDRRSQATERRGGGGGGGSRRRGLVMQ